MTENICEKDMSHTNRIEEALEEINHLEYNVVEEAPGDADVRVRTAEHMENALVNNCEWAQFHAAGYVAHHVDYGGEFVDLRAIDGVE